MRDEPELLTRILDLVSDYHDRTHAPEPFMPGVSRVASWKG